MYKNIITSLVVAFAAAQFSAVEANLALIAKKKQEQAAAAAAAKASSSTTTASTSAPAKPAAPSTPAPSKTLKNVYQTGKSLANTVYYFDKANKP